MVNPASVDAASLVVALATFRRPEALDRILPLLVRQVQDLGLLAHVLVVDNDPAGGAFTAVAGFAARGVRYVHEPNPGISAARNRALDECQGVDLLVFIDDDETPSEGWLEHLVSTWSSFRSIAVTGPVVPAFEAPVSEWVEASGVFARRVLPTGATVAGAATNNLLLDLRQLNTLGLRFDDRFGLSGGSDTMLTRDLVRRGGVISWCDEASVVDVIPAERATKAWVLRRTIRTSNDWGRIHVALASSRATRTRVRIELTAKALFRIFQGSVIWLAGILSRSTPRKAVGACGVASGSGLLLGTYGVVWSEYRRA